MKRNSVSAGPWLIVWTPVLGSGCWLQTSCDDSIWFRFRFRFMWLMSTFWQDLRWLSWSHIYIANQRISRTVNTLSFVLPQILLSNVVRMSHNHNLNNLYSKCRKATFTITVSVSNSNILKQNVLESRFCIHISFICTGTSLFVPHGDKLRGMYAYNCNQEASKERCYTHISKTGCLNTPKTMKKRCQIPLRSKQVCHTWLNNSNHSKKFEKRASKKICIWQNMVICWYW